MARLGGTATLLGELDEADLEALADPGEPIPETTLPALLRRVRAARRRRFGLVAAAAAAVVAALVVALWPAPASAPSQRMVAVSASPLTATATLTAADGGTRITLACHEAGAAGYGCRPAATCSPSSTARASGTTSVAGRSTPARTSATAAASPFREPSCASC